MGRRTPTAIGALAALGAVLCSSAQAAPGKLLDVGRDDGLPVAFAKGTAVGPRAMLVRVTGAPDEPVEVTWDTNCARGAKGRVREGAYTTSAGGLRRIKHGFRRPDDCLVNVIAAYANHASAGTLTIELFAR
ncbi:MAG TPA: hypothetical protein VHH72_10890 [Solirubrobacterales bacterium]|jgi:hypothetical protein|nr:hypothetical protein [Solirubrobacterales bacterium]